MWEQMEREISRILWDVGRQRAAAARLNVGVRGFRNHGVRKARAGGLETLPAANVAEAERAYL